MKREFRIRLACAAMAVAIGMASWNAHAADAPPIEGAQLLNPEADASHLLGDVYKLEDETVSFEICPPADSRLINRRGGVDLMSFIVDNKSWGGSLQLVNIANNTLGDMGQLKASMSLEGYIKASLDEINKTFKGVQKIDDSKLEFDKHSASMLTISMVAELGTGLPGGVANNRLKNQTEMVPLLRQQMIVQMKENQFMVLTFYCPLKDQQVATQTFKAMLKTFVINDPVEQRTKRAKAVVLGKAWLESITAEQLAAKINKQPQLFRTTINGVDIGYARFDEREKTNVGLKGIELEMNSRMFKDDGQTVYGKNIAFWAYSRDQKGVAVPHYSMWDNITKIAVPSPRARGGAVAAPAIQEFWIEETGALNVEANPHFTEQDLKDLEAQRQEEIKRDPAHIPPPIAASAKQYHLCVNLGGDPSQNLHRAAMGFDEKLPANSPTPLPKILEYAWPRLVDLTKPSEMSFLIFNSATQKVALRTLIVTGVKETIQAGGRPQECWKCIDELDPGSTTIWVDSVGNIVAMRTSDKTMLTPTTEPEMQRRWADRIEKQ